MPGGGGRPGQRGGTEPAAASRGQPFAELDAAGLVQQVDHRVAVAAHRERAACPGQRPRRADAVGQEGLRGRAQADAGAAAAQQVDVVPGEVGGVHHRAARPQRPGVVQHPRRGGPVGRQAGLVLRGLLGQVRVQRRPEAVRPVDDRAHLDWRHRAHRVDGHPGPGVRREHPVLVGPHRGQPVRPPGRVPVAEPLLHRRQRLGRPVRGQPAREVAGVQQRDPQARLGRGLDQGAAHLVGVGVR